MVGKNISRPLLLLEKENNLRHLILLNLLKGTVSYRLRTNTAEAKDKWATQLMIVAKSRNHKYKIPTGAEADCM